VVALAFRACRCQRWFIMPLCQAFREEDRRLLLKCLDFCDSPAGLTSQNVYGFCACDFGMCEGCHSRLPEHCELIPLRWSARQLWPFSAIDAMTPRTETSSDRYRLIVWDSLVHREKVILKTIHSLLRVQIWTILSTLGCKPLRNP
jgi:hypothetical protein